jgi:hypothetical protein
MGFIVDNLFYLEVIGRSGIIQQALIFVVK